jgi:hypothetical protein
MEGRTTQRVIVNAAILTAVGCVLLALNCSKKAEKEIGYIPSHEERIGWWREAKFGMFIH